MDFLGIILAKALPVKMLRRIVLVIMAAWLGALSRRAHACPLIDGMIDFNCDGQLKVAVTGDSVVKGDGDSPKRPPGGYVTRLEEILPSATFANLGIDGVTTTGLLRAFKRNLTKAEEGETKRKTRGVDMVIIDVGRNDYFGQRPPSFTVRNISRIVKYLRSELGKQGVEPFIAVSTLIPSTRSFQQPFIDSVNRLLIGSKSKSLPVFLRPERISLRAINEDGIHPNGRGYDLIARRDRNYLKGRLQKQLQALRPDKDRDGVFDVFEADRFGTDPKERDTDGDGLSDGEELFETMTDPLTPDTDMDGLWDVLDRAEGLDPAGAGA